MGLASEQAKVTPKNRLVTPEKRENQASQSCKIMSTGRKIPKLYSFNTQFTACKVISVLSLTKYSI